MTDRSIRIASCLFQLDQRAAEVLRVQKQNGLAMSACFRFAVAEYTRALRLERIAGGADVRHFVADMVDAAVGILLQKFRNWRTLAQRLQQLDLRIGQRDEYR